MSWIAANGLLPNNTSEYTMLLRALKDQTMMPMLEEKQNLNQVYWSMAMA